MRWRLPPVVVRVGAYWLGMAALTYGLVFAHRTDASADEAEPSATIASLPASESTLPAADPQQARALHEPAMPRADTAAPTPLPAELAAVDPGPADVPDVTAPARQEPLVHGAPESESAPEPWLWSERPREPAAEPEPQIESAAAAPSSEVRYADTPDALPSCEAVVASAKQEVDFGTRGSAADLSRDAFANVLENGAYLGRCNLGDRTALDICVAVQAGRAKGVSVSARPANAALVACVKSAVTRLRFPYSDKLDVTHTRFDAVQAR